MIKHKKEKKRCESLCVLFLVLFISGIPLETSVTHTHIFFWVKIGKLATERVWEDEKKKMVLPFASKSRCANDGHYANTYMCIYVLFLRRKITVKKKDK